MAEELQASESTSSYRDDSLNGVTPPAASGTLDTFFRRLGHGQGGRLWGFKDESSTNSSNNVDILNTKSTSNRSNEPTLSASPQPSVPERSIAESLAPSEGDPSARPGLSFREKKFDNILSEEVVNLTELRKLSWNGIPGRYRPTVWKLISGYMPSNRDRRDTALLRKRREYNEAVSQYFEIDDAARTSQEQVLLRQILVDMPRTAPESKIFQKDIVQRSMTRALYVWAVRHPASGYVQGINDLITPFYVVFLAEHMSFDKIQTGEFQEHSLREVEADAYWCLTKLLDQIQDHYTATQTGLQRMVFRLEELVRRIDLELYTHLADQGVQFIQFAFRWMNCLLMRELPLVAIVRIWDTYMSEEAGFESFHVYMCVALLCKYAPELIKLDFASLVLFLQDLPTKHWKEWDVEPLLSQAFILSTLFEHSSAHLNV